MAPNRNSTVDESRRTWRLTNGSSRRLTRCARSVRLNLALAINLIMNKTLRAVLLAMREKDISTRASLVEKGELSDNNYHPVMKLVHEENNKRIKEIIKEFGWPLESEVGEDGAEAAWLIVQHAVERGEAKGWFLAYLQDRVLTRQGKPQIYGTQHEVVNGRMKPMKTESPDEVNKRRDMLGIWSQEEHTTSLQKDYDDLQINKAKRGA